MVTSRKRTTKSNGNGQKNSTAQSASEMTASKLAQRIRSAIKQTYKVQIATRDERLATKVGHAAREKLGKDIQAQLDKQRRNGNGKNISFNWREWNATIFPKILGEPDHLQYPVETVADAMSLLYDSISEGTEGAIADLVQFNAESLKRRNEFSKELELEDDFDDLDEEEDSEEIDDLLDEDLEDDEDFELDDEDDSEL